MKNKDFFYWFTENIFPKTFLIRFSSRLFKMCPPSQGRGGGKQPMTEPLAVVDKGGRADDQRQANLKKLINGWRIFGRKF